MMPVKADLAVYSSAIGVSAWIVQECGFQVKPLFGFQFLRVFANQVTNVTLPSKTTLL